MEIYRGKVLHSGIAAGKIHILERGLHVEKKKAGSMWKRKKLSQMWRRK